MIIESFKYQMQLWNRKLKDCVDVESWDFNFGMESYMEWIRMIEFEVESLDSRIEIARIESKINVAIESFGIDF